MKNLIFSQDDILLAILDAKNDSFARAEMVRALISSKLNRLKSEKKFEHRKLSREFGSLDEIERRWNDVSVKDRKKINSKVNKINSLIKQIDALANYKQELARTSFSNEHLEKLESNIVRVFKWKKPVFYDDLFHG